MKKYTVEEAQERLNEIEEIFGNSVTQSRIDQIRSKVISFGSLEMLKKGGYFENSDPDSELYDLGFYKVNSIEIRNIADDEEIVDVPGLLINNDDYIKLGYGPHLTVRKQLNHWAFVRAAGLANLTQRTMKINNFNQEVFDVTFYAEPGAEESGEHTIDIILYYKYIEYEESEM